jgi:hypothetical protein
LADDGLPVVDLLKGWVQHWHALGWPLVLGMSLGVGLFSFLLGLLVMVGLPADYFIRGKKQPKPAHPVFRLSLKIMKNLIGGLILFAGLVMAIPMVPGPGLLFILIGIGMIDFPGKQALERRLLREPHVLSSVNKIRARFGKSPLLTEGIPPQSVVDSGA